MNLCWTPPVIKICEWGPWGVHNICLIDQASSLGLGHKERLLNRDGDWNGRGGGLFSYTQPIFIHSTSFELKS